MTSNIIMRMVAGKRYFGEDDDNEEAKKFRGVMNEVITSTGVLNPADYFPVFGWIDYKGIEKNLARPEYYTDVVIKGIIVVMLLEGTDTSAVIIEWAMTVLLKHPEKLDKARAEVDNLVGNNRLINKSDLSSLPYLQNIILETFRLFPVAPMSLPHESSRDFKLGGYDIPRGTMLLANAWAIQRDPMVWSDDPTSFKPERFEVGKVGPTKVLQFGMGRRSCPSNGLAQRVVGLGLASLIQCFQWRRIDEALVDLIEGEGAIVLSKCVPLEAKCKARDVLLNVL
ncbi:hypothetical protein BUALT_Bualt04G0105700 [Buddleja alternifolia]|uniref:Cytochrome P450 n=1 Tax=Buddleja alternifolia TaxID=168488 RepID=A0AAV6XW18_9LAMI|nr:hypothetical protein BUALT_Bualt04G0105700 [Buddleja alternifolia]